MASYPGDDVGYQGDVPLVDLRLVGLTRATDERRSTEHDDGDTHHG
jgi:hypothetical protein